MSPKLLSEWVLLVLQGKTARWPEGIDLQDMETIDWYFEQEGIGPLCHYWLQQTEQPDDIPEKILALLKKKRLLHTAATLHRNHQDTQVIELLSSKGFNPIILKGAAYAATLYPSPELRPRCDTDLLFPDRATADQALELLKTAGYETNPNVVDGNLISYQKTCVKTGAISHALDIHWALSNTQAFSRALPYDELTAHTVPLETIHPQARTLDAPYRLFFATLHFFGHERVEHTSSLLWYYDIQQLARQMLPRDWNRFETLVVSKQLAGVSIHVLEQVQSALPFPLEKTLAERLKNAGMKESFHPEKTTSPTKYKLQDLRFMPGWKERFQWVYETFIPSPSYMMNKYQTNNKYLLPYLYCKRALEGFHKKWRQ